MDALGLEKVTLVGHDWGGRAAYQVAANWPERLERLITLSVPYHSHSALNEVKPSQQAAYWYQWVFQTHQAREVLKQKHADFCRYLWQTWMASGHFSEDEFNETLPDWKIPIGSTSRFLLIVNAGKASPATSTIKSWNPHFSRDLRFRFRLY